MKETVITWRPKRYATKPGINRRDGDCDQLLNTTPMRTWGAEVSRYGYESAGLASLPSDITAGYYRYASTEVPSAKEVLFLFGTDSSSVKHIYMDSHVAQGGSTWSDGWVLVDEQIAGTIATGSIVGATDTTFAITGPTTSVVADYYNNWLVYNSTKDEYTIVSDYDGAGNFTSLHNLGSSGLAWADGDSIAVRRWGHGPVNVGAIYGAVGGVSGASDTTFTISNASPAVVATADYYNGCLAYNATTFDLVPITDYAANGTFTTSSNVGSSGLNWSDGDDLYIYQPWGYGDNNPTYAIPNVITREGVYRINGGKSSLRGARGLWAGFIDRTFFKGETQQIAYKGTYVDWRPLDTGFNAPFVWNPAAGFSQTTAPSGYDALTSGKTYWGAIGTLYDGYQYGPIQEFDTGLSLTSGNVVQYALSVGCEINKRVTHIILYLAQDNGNTASTGRENPYYEVARIALCDDDYQADKWSYTAGTGKFDRTVSIGLKEWERRGNSFETSSGYGIGTETLFSADIEIPSNSRQWLARVYNYTRGQEDLDRLYTNPVSAEGVVQPDIFSLEPDVYVGRALWGDSSYITAVFPTERGRLIVLKDRAVVDMGVEIAQDGSILFSPTVVSTQTGCASFTGAVNTPFGIFFAGYDDIWRYDGRLAPLTQRDWEGDYRSIAAAYKQACIAWFRPEDNSVFFQLQTAATPTYYQYAYFLATEDWRQNQYTDTMLGYTVKRDGTVVWWKSGGTSYKFSTSKSDAGASFYAKWQTGYFRPFSAGTAGIFREAFLNKQQVASSGTLDVNLKLSYDGTATTKAYTGLTKSDRRLDLQLGLDDSAMFDLISIEYNVNASGETGGTTEQVEFGDVEIFAFETPKVRQA